VQRLCLWHLVQAVLRATWVLCDFMVRGLMVRDMQCNVEGWLVAAGPSVLSAAASEVCLLR
jgi:hypothetical protein